MYKIILAALLLSGCGIFRPGFVREDSIEVQENSTNEKVEGVDGPTGGHFDKEGNWVPDNEEIPLTYKVPDISAGFIFDINSLDVSPSLQIELLEVDTSVPYLGTIKFDGGVAYQRGYIYVGKLWTNIFEISTGGFIGWNWEEKDLSYGVAATIIKF